MVAGRHAGRVRFATNRPCPALCERCKREWKRGSYRSESHRKSSNELVGGWTFRVVQHARGDADDWKRYLGRAGFGGSEGPFFFANKIQRNQGAILSGCPVDRLSI